MTPANPPSQPSPQLCARCGQALLPGARFCVACGANAAAPAPDVLPAAPPSALVQEKDVGITLLLAIFPALFGFYGVGQLYVERAGRGVAIMVGNWALLLLGGLILAGAIGIGVFTGNLGALLGGVALSGLFFLGSLILLVWQVFDAADLAREWNARAARSRQRPW